MRSTRFRVLTVGGALLALLSMLSACGTSNTAGGATPTTAKKFKVGLVTDTGGLNDKGFNHLADVGLTNAEQQLGIQGSVLESHADTDYVPNLTNFASKGYDLVIAVGFLMSDAVGQVSGEYPNVKFALIDADPTVSGNNVTRANVQGIHFQEEQAGALVGVITGMLEKQGKTPKKSNIVGAVGGQKIPPVDHYIAGFKWAVQHEDPTAQVLIDYSNDFSDPTPCANKTDSQIGRGADVVFQVAGGCGLGVLTEGGKKGVYTIGVDTDQSAVDNSVIASAVKRVDNATFAAIQTLVNGTFQTGAVTFNLSNNGVGFVPSPNFALPSDIQTEVTNVEAQIKSGAVTVPNTVP